MTTLTLLNKYRIKLINPRIDTYDNRSVYDIYILNLSTNKFTIIDTYKPSPQLQTTNDQLKDAMSFITSVANNHITEHNNDQFFVNIYNLLHKVMNNDDIESIYYELMED